MRNGYLDLLRVVGTVAIVLGHIEGLKPLPDYVYPWHVPLYFMLSGWLWRPGSRDFGSEVKVRAKTLLLPYIPWFASVSVVYGIELWRRGRDSTGKVEEQLPGGAYAIEPYSAFWFITALFVAVVTVRGLEALRLPLWLQLAVGVGLCALVQTYQDISVNSPFAIAQGLGCVIFVQAGYLARLLTGRSGQRSRWSRRTLWVMAIATFALGVWITTRPGVGNLNLKFAQFNEPVWAVLAGILISAGMIMAPIYIGGVWSHRISTLAQSGMAVILLHALFVWLGKGHNPYLVAVVAVVVPWTLGLLLARTRWGWVFGCSRPKPLSA